MNRPLRILCSTLAVTALVGVGISSPAEARPRVRTHVVWEYEDWGDVTSRVKTVNPNYRVKINLELECDEEDFNYAVVSWNGRTQIDYDDWWFDVPDDYIKETGYLYPDVRRGYFYLGIPDDCYATLKATQRY